MAPAPIGQRRSLAGCAGVRSGTTITLLGRIYCGSLRKRHGGRTTAEFPMANKFAASLTWQWSRRGRLTLRAIGSGISRRSKTGRWKMTATILPLVTRCLGAVADNPALTGGASEPTLQVQLDTLGGQVYLVPLSVAAAKDILVMLSSWPPMQDFLSGQEPPVQSKPH